MIFSLISKPFFSFLLSLSTIQCLLGKNDKYQMECTGPLSVSDAFLSENKTGIFLFQLVFHYSFVKRTKAVAPETFSLYKY